MLIVVLLATGLLAAPLPPDEALPPPKADAATTVGEILWRDLMIGDSPEVVAQKLQPVAGIKRVEVKNDRRDPLKFRLNIAYDGEGLDIFGELFSVTPYFVERQLRSVTLNGGQRCANDAFERYSAILSLLSEKYARPVHGQPALTRADFADAMGKAGWVTTVLANGSTVVEFTSMFSHFDPPPPSYATGNLAALGRQLMWNEYLSRRAECDGTGAYRSSFAINYLRVSDYREHQREEGRIIERDKKKALDSL